MDRLLFHMLKDDALKNSPSVVSEIKHCSLTSLSYGYHAYFEVSRSFSFESMFFPSYMCLFVTRFHSYISHLFFFHPLPIYYSLCSLFPPLSPCLLLPHLSLSLAYIPFPPSPSFLPLSLPSPPPSLPPPLSHATISPPSSHAGS